MNTAQPIPLPHFDSANNLLPSSPHHHVKRTWNDSFHNLNQPEEQDNDRPSKILHTSTVNGDGPDSSDKNDVLGGDEDLKVKRKEQNRIAQQSFRQRKEQYVRDLELKIKQVQDTHAFATHQLFQENHQLRAIIYQLESENTALKGVLPVDNPFASIIGSLPQAGLGVPLTDPAPNLVPHQTYPKPIAAKPVAQILPQQPFITVQPSVPILPQQPINMDQPTSRSIQKPANEVTGSKPRQKAIHQPKENQQPTLQQKKRQQFVQQKKKPAQQQEEKQQSSQQFSFSITTPATLRHDTLNKNAHIDPIELIPLYHPSHDPHAVPPSDDPSATVKAPSAIIIGNDEAIDIPKTPDVSFLDGYDAFERLYDNPSFFENQGLTLSMFQSRRNSLQPDYEEDAVKKTTRVESSSAAPSRPPPVPDMPLEEDEKTPIWEKITEHAQNNKFSVDHLVEAVRHTTASKRKNKLLVDEWELEAMVNDLHYYL